jgi:hypothetical protein
LNSEIVKERRKEDIMTYHHHAGLFSFLQLLLITHVAALECAHPNIMTEATQVDVQLGSGDEAGDMSVWDGNDLCDGLSAPDGCASIGKAYGTCLTLSTKNSTDPAAPFPNLDCVDTFIFPDGSSLITRGIVLDDVDDSVVVGGTGCYYGAQGYAKVTYNEADNSFTYDLTTVVVELDEEGKYEGGPLSEKIGGRGLRRE